MWRDEVENLDNLFLQFAGDLGKILISKRLTKESLTSEEILEVAPILEEFLIEHFKISAKKHRSKVGIFQKMAIVKREFVQRKVALKYKDFEGLEPPFLSEEEFTLKVLSGVSEKNLEEELISYARFALFSEAGKLRHKNGMLFKLPAKISLPFTVAETGEILYTAVKNFKKTEEENFGHVKYCIYCHKQGKDYCRKGNPVALKDGCPLDQKISEMNILKSEGGLISPLACMMIDNPLCILTGDRICNDCKKACIFQKQEAVDIPSIESQILSDVLALPFGFEIYALLLKWNPLLTENFLPKPFNGKKVLVCGAGPSGIANAYYFLQEGFEVVMIDGLKIENVESVARLKKYLRNPLKNASTILNYDTTKRLKGGFGGVMEYGITSRFNKNLLSLCQILFEREPLFTLCGAKKFGVEITLEEAKRMGFCHVLMCIGAGNPKLPAELHYLKEGIFTASNFLMSANLEQDWGRKKILSPVLIIGGGLTAMDCAFLAREILGSEGEIAVFVRRDLENSPSFQLNEVEVEDVLSKKIRIFQNKKIKEIREAEVIFEDGEIFAFKTLVFAIGTSPNVEFLKNEENLDFWTKFGDLDKNFEGSVVKAIASAKLKKDEIFQRLSKIPASNLKTPNFSCEVVSLTQKNVLYRLEVKPFYSIKANPLEVFKLQTFGNNYHSIPLTLFEISKENISKDKISKSKISKNNVSESTISEGNLVFYFRKTAEATSELASLKPREKISLMRATASKIPTFERIFTEDEAFIPALKKVCKEVILLKNFSHQPNKKTLFYVKDRSLLKSVPKSENYFIFLFTEMNCMLSGVCSRCLTKNPDGSFFYACSANIKELS
jgi:NADPH-dependent glutamate synthase beta subunit-like oxidoreductase